MSDLKFVAHSLAHEAREGMNAEQLITGKDASGTPNVCDINALLLGHQVVFSENSEILQRK